MVTVIVSETAAWLDRRAVAMRRGALRTALVLGSGVLLAYAPPMVTAVLALAVVIGLVPRGYRDRSDAQALKAERLGMLEHMKGLEQEIGRLHLRARITDNLIEILRGNSTKRVPSRRASRARVTRSTARSAWTKTARRSSPQPCVVLTGRSFTPMLIRLTARLKPNGCGGLRAVCCP